MCLRNVRCRSKVKSRGRITSEGGDLKIRNTPNPADEKMLRKATIIGGGDGSPFQCHRPFRLILGLGTLIV